MIGWSRVSTDLTAASQRPPILGAVGGIKCLLIWFSRLKSVERS